MGGFLNRLFMPCSFQIGFLGWSKPSPFHLKNAFFLQRTVLQNSFPDFFTKKKWPFFQIISASDPFIVFREKLQEGSRSSKNGFYVTDCQLAFSKQHILKNLCWLNGTPAIHHSENIPSKLCSMHAFVSLKYWVDMKLNIFPTFGYCAT